MKKSALILMLGISVMTMANKPLTRVPVAKYSVYKCALESSKVHEDTYYIYYDELDQIDWQYVVDKYDLDEVYTRFETQDFKVPIKGQLYIEFKEDLRNLDEDDFFEKWYIQFEKDGQSLIYYINKK